MPNLIYPAPLNKGDIIGIMSPSSYIEKDDLDQTVRVIKGHDYQVYVHPQSLNRHNQSAGTNAEKCEAFHDLIKNPDIKAIIFSTGGNRALNWVDDIDYELVKNNPKILMGFSDVSSILNLVSYHTGLMTFHGPNARWFMVHENNKQDIEQCFEMLRNPQNALDVAIKSLPQNKQSEHSFLNNASFIGGNTSLILYLIHEIDFTDKILFLEDRYVETSRLDRDLCHFKRQGVFNKIKGLILGNFSELLDSERPFGFTLDDMIAEHVPADLPIIKNAPFGHGERLITLPVTG
jgi:muramoyltetrapeptide carboxypeptidase